MYEHLEHLVLTQQVILQRLETIRDQEKPEIVPFNPAEHHLSRIEDLAFMKQELLQPL